MFFIHFFIFKKIAILNKLLTFKFEHFSFSQAPYDYSGSSEKTIEIMENKIEVPIPMEVMKELSLEVMHAMLLDLLKKLDPNKPVYYLADPNKPNKVQPTTKETFEAFINDAVVEKKKIGELSAKDRMVDLIYRISGGIETLRNEQTNKLKAQVDTLLADKAKVLSLNKNDKEINYVQPSTSGYSGKSGKDTEEISIMETENHDNGNKNPNISSQNQIMLKTDWVKNIPVFKASDKDILDEWVYVIEIG